MKTWVGTDGKTLVNDTGKTYACEYCPCTYHCDEREVTATYSVPEDYATLDEAIAAHGNEYYTKIIFKGTYTSLLPVFKCVIDGDGVATFSGGAYALNHYNNFDTFYGEIINANITGAGIWYSRLIYCKIYDIDGDNTADARLRGSWFNMAYLKSCCGCEITNIRSQDSRVINGANTAPGEIYISAQGCTIDGVIGGSSTLDNYTSAATVTIGGFDTIVKNVTSGTALAVTYSPQHAHGGHINISITIDKGTSAVGGVETDVLIENITSGDGGDSTEGSSLHGSSGGSIGIGIRSETDIYRARHIRTGKGGNGAVKMEILEGKEHASSSSGGHGGNIDIGTYSKNYIFEDFILGNGGNSPSVTAGYSAYNGNGGNGGSIYESSISNGTFKDITLGNGGSSGSVTAGDTANCGRGGYGGFIGYERGGTTNITDCAFINITFGNAGDNGTPSAQNVTFGKAAPSGGFGQGSYGCSYQDSDNCSTNYICGCYFENITFGTLGAHSPNVGSAGAGGYAGNGGSSITGKGGNGGDLHSTQQLPAGAGGSGNPAGSNGTWYSC